MLAHREGRHVQVWDAMTFSSRRWKSKRQKPFEVAYIVDLFAVVICNPWGVGASFKRGMVLSQRFIVRPVSTVMNLARTT